MQDKALSINASFASQRVTGQQRYAHEISEALRRKFDYEEVRPGPRLESSALLVWLWVLTVATLKPRRGLLLSLTARAPVWRRRHVVVVHDLFVLTNPEWFSRLYVAIHAPLLRAHIRYASALIAVSEPVARQVGRYRNDIVEVAPNAPGRLFLAGPSEVDHSEYEALGLPSGEYFLTVGSRDPRKNLSGLVQAYGSLGEEERRGHPLVVVGGGNSIFKIEDGVERVAGVRILGYVSDEVLRSLYSHARSVVFVSHAEGFGLPIVEAIAAGARSLILSDLEVFRWICGSEAIYVDPSSPTSIANGLRSEIEIRRSSEIDISRFSWECSAKVIDDVCRKVQGGFGK